MADFEDGVNGLALVQDVVNGNDAGGVAREAGDAGLVVDDDDGNAVAAQAADHAESGMVAAHDERTGDGGCGCTGGRGAHHFFRLKHSAHGKQRLRFSCGDGGTSWPARWRPTRFR